MADLCRKCSERPAANGQRWCSRCRKGKGRTPGENAVLRPEDVGHDFKSPPCAQCAVLLSELARVRGEMERLQLDQARLKQELSEARKAAGEMKVLPASGVTVAVGTAKRASAPSRSAVTEWTCGGPRRCQRQACACKVHR